MKTINGAQIMEQGFLDLREFINYENPGSFLSRGDYEKLKVILTLGLFELDGVFIKKIGYKIPDQLIGQTNMESSQEGEVGVLSDNYNKLKKENEELQKQLNEANETIKKQLKQMDDDDREFLALEKEHKELKKKMEQMEKDGKGSQESYTIDGVEMSVEDIVCGYMAKCRVVDEKERNIEKLKKEMDEQIQKMVGEIMKKNEYLQEDITKANKQVDEYKREAANTAKYFLKFKVAYDMMIENGAKQPDQKLVEKEVQKLLKAKEEQQSKESNENINIESDTEID